MSLPDDVQATPAAPVLKPQEASDLLGPKITSFLGDLATLVAMHGIAGISMVIIDEGVIRVSSTGADAAMREKAREIALVLSEMVVREPG